MANRCSQVSIHSVFAVKDREKFITGKRNMMKNIFLNFMIKIAYKYRPDGACKKSIGYALPKCRPYWPLS
jgi:hypothetical protein